MYDNLPRLPISQALGQATIFSPPNALCFDRQPRKKARTSASGVPNVHLTITAPPGYHPHVDTSMSAEPSTSHLPASLPSYPSLSRYSQSHAYSQLVPPVSSPSSYLASTSISSNARPAAVLRDLSQPASVSPEPSPFPTVPGLHIPIVELLTGHHCFDPTSAPDLAETLIDLGVTDAWQVLEMSANVREVVVSLIGEDYTKDLEARADQSVTRVLKQIAETTTHTSGPDTATIGASRGMVSRGVQTTLTMAEIAAIIDGTSGSGYESDGLELEGGDDDSSGSEFEYDELDPSDVNDEEL